MSFSCGQEMRTLSSLFLLTPPSSPQNLSSLVPMRSGQVPINFTQLAQPNSDGCRPIPVPMPNWLSTFKVSSKGMASLVVRSKHRQKSKGRATSQLWLTNYAS